MRIAGHSEYTVISFSGHGAAVCRFRKRKQQFRIIGSAVQSVADGDPADAVRAALKRAGGATGCVILAGTVNDGGYFRCSALDLPGVREQRAALEFELPKGMIRVPDDPVIQFMSAGTGPDSQWNVYAFPRTGFFSIASLQDVCRFKADAFIYPLLGVQETDPDIPCRVLEKEYVFSGGQWRKGEEKDFVLSEYWQDEFRRLFVFPDDFNAVDHTECLLVMRLIMNPVFRQSERCVRILPARLRPKRLRFHAAIAVILLLCLVGIHAKDFIVDRSARYKEYRTLVQERDNYRRKTTTLKSSLKKRDKENKEIQRILQLEAGDTDLLNRFAELSERLPQDALVTSLRFSEKTVDLVIQTESANLNMPQLVKQLPYWKIAQLQQRNLNGTVNMIIVKLTRAEDEK